LEALMRVVVVSDTHDNYPELPEGDLLIHCGDFSRDGGVEEIERAMCWLAEQPHRHKVVVPGNHDRALEGRSVWDGLEWLGTRLLVDRLVEIEGLKIYGSPWTLPWQNFAFQRTEEELREIYARIPEGLDILVTHGPPYGVLDWTLRGDAIGSIALREAVARTKPRHHVFGHIHEAYGRKQTFLTFPTMHYNCSWVALDKSGPKPPNPPTILEV
jgi:Icc-related predicted phosphoesterase